MTATKAELRTPDELRRELAQCEEEALEAERALGAASLEGKDSAGAQKRLTDARAAVDRVNLALTEDGRRAAEAQKRAADAQRAEQFVEAYRWAAEFCARAEKAVKAHEAAERAAGELRELRDPPGLLKRERKLARIGRAASAGLGFDDEITDLAGMHRVKELDYEVLPHAHWRELRQRATELAEAAEAELAELRSTEVA